MANEKQLQIIKQGVDVWNQWRVKHLYEMINLYGADLSGADLRKAILSWADLSGAYLGETALSRADLENAIFQDAQGIPEWIAQRLDDEGRYSQERLIKAIRNGFKNLSEANLSKANLQEANLQEANLNEANLHRATLSGANLHGTTLSGVKLSGYR